MGVFLFWSAIYICVPTLPLYAQSLGASMTEVGIIVGAYGVTQLLFRLPLGLMQDRLGRRKNFILVGILCVILGTLGLFYSRSSANLLISRAVLGVAAANWVALTLLFSNHFKSGQETWSISMVVFISNLAIILSTFSGGQIADKYGLLAPCYVALALAVLAFCMFLGVREKPTTPNHIKSSSRLVNIARDQRLIKTASVAAISQYVLYAVIYAFVPIFASQIGATRSQVGGATSIYQVCGTLAGLAVTPLVRRCGDRAVIAIGLICITAGTLIVPSIKTVSGLLLAQAVIGLGWGVAHPVLMALSIKKRPSHEKGAALGFFQATYAIGMVTGPLVSGIFADAFGLSGAFYSAGILSLAALLLSIRI
ncbi:MAG: MFS transporter [Anaerolineales bacterium]|nr:MFS transporter [Anaerolineales bacterium]